MLSEKQTNRKTLVISGAGFIGPYLVERLPDESPEIRVFDNSSICHRENIAVVASLIKLVKEDVRDYQSIHESARGVEVVFHQADLCSVVRSVEEPLKTNVVNIELCHNHKRSH